MLQATRLGKCSVSQLQVSASISGLLLPGPAPGPSVYTNSLILSTPTLIPSPLTAPLGSPNDTVVQGGRGAEWWLRRRCKKKEAGSYCLMGPRVQREGDREEDTPRAWETRVKARLGQGSEWREVGSICQMTEIA